MVVAATLLKLAAVFSLPIGAFGQPGSNISLSFGTRYGAVIEQPGASHCYSFSGLAGQRLLYTGLDRDFSSISARLLGPDGTVVGSLDGNADSVLGPAVLTSSGAYHLVVDAADGVTGYYEFIVQDLASASTLPFGAITSGHLSPPGVTDPFVFVGRRGQRISLQSISFSTNLARWRLISPAETLLASASIGNNLGPVTLMADGNYHVLIEGTLTNPASVTPLTYQIMLSDLNDPPVSASGFGILVNASTPEFSYQFTAPAGLPILLNKLFTTFHFPPAFGLIGPSNEVINFEGPILLPRSGTYTVEVTGVSGNYPFRLIDLTTAQPLPLDADVTGRLPSQTFEVATYSFTGIRGQRLIRRVYDYTQPISPFGIALYSPSGKRLNVQDSVPFTLLETGPYYLVLENRSFQGGAPYHFVFRDVSTLPLVPLDTDMSGSLPSDTSAFWRLIGAPGQPLYFDGKVPAGRSWTLFGPSNEILGSGATLDDGFKITIPYRGTCILVISNDTNTVSYSYRIVALASTTNTLTVGAITLGDLVHPGERKSFSFAGTSGQRLLYDSLDDDSEPLWATLTAPNGSTVFHRQNVNLDMDPFRLQEGGIHILSIDGDNDSVGDFAFRIIDLGSASLLALDTQVAATLNPGNETDVYAFEGVAGQHVKLIFSGASSQAEWQLVSSDGVLMYGGAVSAPAPIQELPLSGKYLLIMRGTGSSAASLDYQIAVSDTAESPTPVRGLGEEIAGSIGPSQTNTTTFDAPAGRPVYFQNLSSGFFYVDLIDPTGARLLVLPAWQNFGPYNLPLSGTYTVKVRSESGWNGAYRFRFLDLEVAPVVPFGTIVTNALPASEIGRFPCKGQRLYFDALRNDFSVWGRLVLPGQAGGDFNPGTDRGPFTVPHVGTAYLIFEPRVGYMGVPGMISFRILEANSQPEIPAGVTTVITNLQPLFQSSVYRLNVVAGQTLSLQFLSGTRDRALLYDPDNRTNSNSPEAFTATVAADGQYLLIIPFPPFVSQSVTNVFSVSSSIPPNARVSEVCSAFSPNRAPVLAHIGDHEVCESTTLTFTASATDVDEGQAITFSVDPGAISGAVIDPVAGLFDWKPTVTGVSFTTNVTIRATDTGTPTLSTAETIRVTVRSEPVLSAVVASRGTVTISWCSVPAEIYRLQFKAVLTDPQWVDVNGGISASDWITTFTDPSPATNSQRYYRVLRVSGSQSQQSLRPLPDRGIRP